jgi:hypothetical protein
MLAIRPTSTTFLSSHTSVNHHHRARLDRRPPHQCRFRTSSTERINCDIPNGCSADLVILSLCI